MLLSVYCDLPGALFSGLAWSGVLNGPVFFCPFTMCITCLAEAAGAGNFHNSYNWRLPDSSSIEFHWMNKEPMSGLTERPSREVANFQSLAEEDREVPTMKAVSPRRVLRSRSF